MNAKYTVSIIALVLVTSFSLSAAQSEFCVTIIDDVNDPIALAQHGISPASPESLAGLLDAIANSHHTVTFAYVVVREKADRGVPVTIQIEPFSLTAPKRPDRNLPLAQLETAMADYRSDQLKFETAQRRFSEKTTREREAFIRAALDAQEMAESERDSLKSSKGFAASDIEGTILAAVGIARTSGAGKAILLLNSDLASNRNELFGLVQGRKTASRALTADELPESLLTAIVCVNTSFKPDSSPFLKATKCEKLHAGNLATATELLRGLLDKRSGTLPAAIASSNPN
ncbi:MAG TPA: hypothetical protein VHC20_05395 [Candidatus Paceibacterota bacterium]|nr:hypothetical protein [Candidatus Paceibacterota bacterium]